MLVLMLSGCSMFVAPDTPLPDNAIPLVPVPANYALYWTQIEACSGIVAPMSRVSWYRVPGDIDVHGTVLTASGMTNPSQHWIVLASDVVRNEEASTIRHEILHEILQAKGTGHPVAYFGTWPTFVDGKCGKMVWWQ